MPTRKQYDYLLLVSGELVSRLSDRIFLISTTQADFFNRSVIGRIDELFARPELRVKGHLGNRFSFSQT
jgi:hypothetical protein